MSEYGLTQPRDDDGDPEPVDHTYEWDGEEVTIELVPPTLEQLKEYRDLGTDADMEELEKIVDRHVIKPEMPAAEMTEREVTCYMFGLRDYSESGGGERMQQVREAITERERGGNR